MKEKLALKGPPLMTKIRDMGGSTFKSLSQLDPTDDNYSKLLDGLFDALKEAKVKNREVALSKD
eukprot:CAMPEP_0170497776 /NCGR_PEP_ID=MMETSP0208-20121228/25785_1 /TAXON_ID=197538 /ORGANISM="Strombidium inclinatum, Strain S3" /LENGTH=63 /DNA_ID=CAMNT_0010774705 /DNA_START=229 /DNA_END=420 /DNA_ORIENTATION=-